jgi:hypothetical protein
MRCLFTLLVLLLLMAGSVSAQHHPLPLDTNTIGIQIPKLNFEEVRSRHSDMFVNYTYSTGIPTRVLRMRYQPSKPFEKDTLLLDFVASSPSPVSQFFTQITRPDDLWNPNTQWQPIGWVRADLDDAGRVIRLWGQDALGRYWLWQGSLPFTNSPKSPHSEVKPGVE